MSMLILETPAKYSKYLMSISYISYSISNIETKMLKIGTSSYRIIVLVSDKKKKLLQGT